MKRMLEPDRLDEWFANGGREYPPGPPAGDRMGWGMDGMGGIVSDE